MRKEQVVVATKQKVDVGVAASVSFVIAVTTLSAAAVLDTFLIAFLVTTL